MATYLHPGVYVEEVPSGSKPIEGVSTSVAAFVGDARRGPVGEATLIGSLSDYKEQFGEITSDDPMGLALQAFYLNGGRAAYVCRLAGPDAVTAELVLQAGATNAMTITAKNAGTWANDLFVRVTTSGSSFTLEVGGQNDDGEFEAEETFADLSMDESSETYFVTQVNEGSANVNAALHADNTDSDPPDSTADTGVALSDGTAGVDDSPTNTEFQSFYDDILRKVRDVSIMVVPGESWPADGSGNLILSATLAHCEAVKNRILIVDPPNGHELDQRATVDAMGLPTSTYSVLYYPWLTISNPEYDVDKNPNVSKTIEVAPSAFAAGMWAKIDGKRGVWKAPAGVETSLLGVAGMEFTVEDGEQDVLNPLGVNCVRALPGYGKVIWGSRTLATKADPEWRYVPVRRTAIFIEQSIYNGIQWAVFEPNDHPLWSSLRANIGGFMDGLFRAGAFQGSTANQAYFVRCGLGDTMTQADIDRGQVIVIVGFAPLKPAEFVIVRIQQKVGDQ